MTLGELIDRATELLEENPDLRDNQVLMDEGSWFSRTDQMVVDSDGDIILIQSPDA